MGNSKHKEQRTQIIQSHHTSSSRSEKGMEQVYCAGSNSSNEYPQTESMLYYH